MEVLAEYTLKVVSARPDVGPANSSFALRHQCITKFDTSFGDYARLAGDSKLFPCAAGMPRVSTTFVCPALV